LTPERWAQIEELFHRAVETDGKQRTAMLDEACSSDPELRREIEALLGCEAGARTHVQAVVGSELHDLDFSLAGEVVSHYRILDGLGGGGMGLVYRAEDTKLGRLVALKFLPEGSATDPGALARFEREARAASALEHPNICPIYEFGEHNGQPFLVMQLLEGQTLRELLERATPEPSRPGTGGPQPLEKVLDLGIQIANGLEAAHGKGIIHRDIKPANVFVTTQGQAKILDFGLAKLTRTSSVEGDELEQHSRQGRSTESPPGETTAVAAPDPFLSRTGVAMGTAGYMSPEQARGERLDARTDLFSFGLVLYEMATGQRAFQGDTEPVLRDAILGHTPASPSQLNSKLRAKLEKIINKALEKNRDARYQSAAEIRSDLQSLKEAGEHRSRWREVPAGAVVVLLLVAVILIVAGAVVGLRSWRSRGRPSLESLQITKVTDSGKAEAVAISPDGRYIAYLFRDGEDGSLRLRQIGARGEAQVLAHEPLQLLYPGLTFSPDGNHLYFLRARPKDTFFHDLYDIPTLGGPERKVTSDIDTAVSFSPDGQEFVYERGVTGFVEIRIANPDGSGDRLLAHFQGASGDDTPGAAWSPDGSSIAVAVRMDQRKPGNVLEVISTANGQVRELYSGNREIGRPRWLPAGNIIVVPTKSPSGRTQLWTVSYPAGEIRRLTNDLADYDLVIDTTPDGTKLATIQWTTISNLWVSPSFDASRSRQITSGQQWITNAFILNGKLAMVNRADNELWIRNMDGSYQTLAIDQQDRDRDFSSCGPFIVFESFRSGTSEVTRMDQNGTNARRLTMGWTAGPACSPDGKFVYYAEVLQPRWKIRRVSIDGGPPVDIVDSPDGKILGRAAISPDGHLLAFAYHDRSQEPAIKVAVVPISGGSLIRKVDVAIDIKWWNGLHWSPDGLSLQYPLDKDGVTNLWEQPLAGGPPKQITKFSSGRIFDFNWTPDGRQLLLCRGESSSDVVLLSNLR
jgi:eukaryotic-like serine/threonine-protein kinase